MKYIVHVVGTNPHHFADILSGSVSNADDISVRIERELSDRVIISHSGYPAFKYETTAYQERELFPKGHSVILIVADLDSLAINDSQSLIGVIKAAKQAPEGTEIRLVGFSKNLAVLRRRSKNFFMLTGSNNGITKTDFVDLSKENAGQEYLDSLCLRAESVKSDQSDQRDTSDSKKKLDLAWEYFFNNFPSESELYRALSAFLCQLKTSHRQEFFAAQALELMQALQNPALDLSAKRQAIESFDEQCRAALSFTDKRFLAVTLTQLTAVALLTVIAASVVVGLGLTLGSLGVVPALVAGALMAATVGSMGAVTLVVLSQPFFNLRSAERRLVEAASRQDLSPAPQS